MRGPTGLTARGWLAVSAVAFVVVLLTAWVAGSRSGPPTPTGGSVRLGPEPGQPVAAYLASLPATLPPPGATAPALVQLDTPRDAPSAAALLTPAHRAESTAGPAVDRAVFRVPIERVQTALRFEPVTGTGDVAAALGVARERAAHAAEAEASRAAPGRRADVLRAERRALADPACSCVLALVVTADRPTLEALATRPGVRAVQAAPPATRPRDLALSPLLPEQTTAATPPSDDGPVPPVPSSQSPSSQGN